MKRHLRVALTLGLAALLAACGAGDGHAVGTYQLDAEALLAAMPGADQMPKEMRDRLVPSIEGSIELAADHTAHFRFKMPMADEKNEAGTWKLDGEKLTMTSGSGDEQETKTGTLAGGAITVRDERDGQVLTMTFRKR